MPNFSALRCLVRRNVRGTNTSICNCSARATIQGTLAGSSRACSTSRHESRARKQLLQGLDNDDQTKAKAVAFDMNQTLQSLLTSQLQRIGRLIGVVFTAATKAELLARIHEGLKTPKLNPVGAATYASSSSQLPGGSHRILSIDMGIRNLAFCRLSVSDNPTMVKADVASTGETDTSMNAAGPASFVPFGPVTVEDWNHLPLYESSPASLAVGATDAVQKFTPDILAGWALYILDTLVLKAPGGPPSTILIEKQRWRSGGFSAVQEWTIRVNSLEAMLWMGLRVLQNSGQWKGQVHAVDPGVATRFWFDKETEDKLTAVKVQPDQHAEGAPKAMKKSEASKTAKIEVARDWIKSGSTRCEGERETDIELQPPVEVSHQKLQFSDAIKGFSEVFYWKNERQAARKEAGVDEVAMSAIPMGKRNDLADCLLQGVAWIKWEQNRRAINSGQAVLAQGKVSPTRQVGKESKVKGSKAAKTSKAPRRRKPQVQESS